MGAVAGSAVSQTPVKGLGAAGFACWFVVCPFPVRVGEDQGVGTRSVPDRLASEREVGGARGPRLFTRFTCDLAHDRRAA